MEMKWYSAEGCTDAQMLKQLVVRAPFPRILGFAPPAPAPPSPPHDKKGSAP